AYELLTGELPWKGVGINVMARILSEIPAPIRDLDPDVPEDAAAVVMQALSRNADERFPSMDELIAALEPFADPASRSAPPSVHRSLTPARLGGPLKPPANPPGGVATVRPPSSEPRDSERPAAAENNRTQRSAGLELPPDAPAPRLPRTPQVEIV